jgi:hypothetical protein
MVQGAWEKGRRDAETVTAAAAARSKCAAVFSRFNLQAAVHACKLAVKPWQCGCRRV